jgi:hypothetical protein
VAAPKVKTVKRLFAVSGNRCAFPNCENSLVDAASGEVTGEICHIKGDKTGSARYDPNQSEEERQGFGNLVLMCSIHHTVIDDDVDSYTVARLHEIKAKHEAAYAGGGEPSDEIAERFILNITTTNIIHGSIVAPKNQSGGQVAHSIINVHAPIPQEEEDPFTDCEPIQPFLTELGETLTGHPLVRIIIVLDTKTIAYNWPNQHLMFSSDEYPSIRETVSILEGHGFVRVEKRDFAYRMTERFVSELRKRAVTANRYKIHDELLKWLRKGPVIHPWEKVMPEVDRQALQGAIALLRDEKLAEITVGGHCVPDMGRAPTFHEITQFGPAFNGHLTDRGIRVVDEYRENIVAQYLKNKGV